MSLIRRSNPFSLAPPPMGIYMLVFSFVIRKYLLSEKGESLRVKNENRFQSALIKEIRSMLPGCFVLKNDGSNTPQGFPDLLILYKDQWGSLECKKTEKAARQPNQEYYVGVLNDMSFSRFISPENKDEVLNELYSTFGLGGTTRISGSK